MYRITIEEEKVTYSPGSNDQQREWVTKSQITSGESAVIAGALRAQAEVLDPPKKY